MKNSPFPFPLPEREKQAVLPKTFLKIFRKKWFLFSFRK